MKLHLIPTFDIMNRLYDMPISQKRFNTYIKKLRGGQSDGLQLPIGGYNPMAGNVLHSLLKELIERDIEQLITYEIEKWNAQEKNKPEYGLAINLIDCEGGLWSQRYLTEYDNRFKNQALFNRNMISLNLYRGEPLENSDIVMRFNTSCYRTLYQLQNGIPQHLNECIAQELYVNEKCGINKAITTITEPSAFVNTYGNSDAYNHIFYFFYGKNTCEELGYPSTFSLK